MIRINLLPRERVQRQPLAPRLLLILVGAIAIVAVAAATLALSARNNAVRGRIARVEEQITVLRPKVERVAQLRRAIENARRKAELLKSLEASRVPWDVILEELRAILPKDVWLTQLEALDAGNMSFGGYALSYTAVARFMVSLEDSKMFQNVDMTISQKQMVAGREIINFSLIGQFVRAQKEASVR